MEKAVRVCRPTHLYLAVAVQHRIDGVPDEVDQQLVPLRPVGADRP